MTLKDSIRAAYNAVHAPDDLTERLKQELYQKDLPENAEESTFHANPPKKPAIGKYSAYIVACVAICGCCVLAGWGLQSGKIDFIPAKQITHTSTTATESYEEETTLPTETSEAPSSSPNE